MYGKLKHLSDEEFSNLIRACTSYRQIILKLNLTGGSNYNTIKLRIKQLNLNIDHFTGKAWNKGKNKANNESIKKYSETISKKFKGKHNHFHDLKTRQKISEAISKRILNASFKFPKSKWIDVFNVKDNCFVKVQGTWEFLFAEWLNKSEIEWIRPKQKFLWRKNKNDIFHSYHPDFYLPAIDCYIEIKGYMWKDKSRKIDDFKKLKYVQQQNKDLKLIILMKNELKILGIF